MKRYLKQYLFLILAGTIIVIGILTSVFLFLQDNPIKNREYLPINEKTTLHLKPGHYTTFYEFDQSQSHYGPVTFIRSNRVANMDDLITLHVERQSDQVNVKPDASMTYTMNQITGESFYSFTIKEEGDYDIFLQIKEDRNEISSIRMTLIADFAKVFLSILKYMGMVILISSPFLTVGFYKYWREGKRRAA